MANPKQIILPEHNSSRLIFIDNNNVNLLVDNTTRVSECDCYYGTSRMQIGKLNDYIWIIEDVGEYDTNHQHSADLYYIDPNTNERKVLYNVTRIFEYNSECDRAYVQHGGGHKMIIVFPSNKQLSANFYLKYAKNTPNVKEEVIYDTANDNYLIYTYKYDESGKLGINDLIGIVKTLNITTDELDNAGNPKPMEGVSYIDLSIDSVDVTMNQIRINYHIGDNNTDDLKVGVLGINSATDKFISPLITDDRIEPLYFIIEPPKNRSWIFLRIDKDEEHNVATPPKYYTQPTNRMVGEYHCGYLWGNMIGFKGIYNENDNTYEYNIDVDSIPMIFSIPEYYLDYKSIQFFDENDNELKMQGPSTNWPHSNTWQIYNEYDGICYFSYLIHVQSKTKKIKLVYDANIVSEEEETNTELNDYLYNNYSEEDDLNAVSELKVGDILAINNTHGISIVDGDENDSESLIVIHQEDYEDYVQSHNITPIGVCVIPDNFISHDENDLDYFGRFVYIDNLPWTYEEDVDLHTFDYFGPDEVIDTLPVLNNIPIINRENVYEVNDHVIRILQAPNGQIPVDTGKFVDISNTMSNLSGPIRPNPYKCPTDETTYYNFELGAVTPPYDCDDWAPSPYKFVNGKYILNRSQYFMTKFQGNSINNVLTDTLGLLNTYEYQKINISKGQHENGEYEYTPIYKTLNIEILNNKNILYVPAAGEAGFIISKFNVINTSLELINATLFGYYGHPEKDTSFVEWEEPVLYYCSTQADVPLIYHDEDPNDPEVNHWTSTAFQTFDMIGGAGCLGGGYINIMPQITWEGAVRPFLMYDPKTKSLIQLTNDNEKHWHKLHI